MSTVADRVAAGAAFLDQHDPGWWRADSGRAIDLKKLYLGNGERCILGQRCPLETWQAWGGGSGTPYTAFLSILSGLEPYTDAAENWAAERGFQASEFGDAGDEYADLTAEWIRVIEKRQAAS